MPNYINPPPQNPIARFIAGIVAVLAVAGAFMIGFAALLVVAGLGMLAGIVIWLRVAWIKRKLKKNGFTVNGFNSGSANQPGNLHGQQPDQQSERQRDQGHQGQVIDAEYEVVSDKKDPPP